ncbi:MAG: hypothetical protein ACRCV0_04640 [Brevinema sp.]
MKKIVLILVILFVSVASLNSQQKIVEKPSDQGWYYDFGVRGAWNFAGICIRNKISYRKALSRDKKHILFQNSYLETGVELGLGPFAKSTAFVIWQPILPLRFQARIGYYRDLLGDVLVDGPKGEYNHGYLAFTGLNPGTYTEPRVNSDTLEIEFAPTLTLGGKVGEGALALIYTPHMHYFYSSGISESQYRYFARESIIIKKQDIFWHHKFLFGYSFTSVGVTLGVSATVQHIQSIGGIFRAGMFGVIAYESPVPNKPNIIPYLRAQMGSWIKDRYLAGTFVIQAEFGVKYLF